MFDADTVKSDTYIAKWRKRAFKYTVRVWELCKQVECEYYNNKLFFNLLD